MSGVATDEIVTVEADGAEVPPATEPEDGAAPRSAEEVEAARQARWAAIGAEAPLLTQPVTEPADQAETPPEPVTVAAPPAPATVPSPVLSEAYRLNIRAQWDELQEDLEEASKKAANARSSAYKNASKVKRIERQIAFVEDTAAMHGIELSPKKSKDRDDDGEQLELPDVDEDEDGDGDFEDDGCPVGDPDCTSREDELHIACESPASEPAPTDVELAAQIRDQLATPGLMCVNHADRLRTFILGVRGADGVVHEVMLCEECAEAHHNPEAPQTATGDPEAKTTTPDAVAAPPVKPEAKPKSARKPRVKPAEEPDVHRSPALAVGTEVEVISGPGKGLIGKVVQVGVVTGDGRYTFPITIEDARGTRYAQEPEDLKVLAATDQPSDAPISRRDRRAASAHSEAAQQELIGSGAPF